jgi:hypothetical protein
MINNDNCNLWQQIICRALVLIRSIVKTGLSSSKPHTGVKVCGRPSTGCMVIMEIVRPLRNDTRGKLELFTS